MATDGIEIGLKELRSLDQALADLRTRYERTPTKTLARMISQLEAGIAARSIRKQASAD
jgi:hypothetical protein